MTRCDTWSEPRCFGAAIPKKDALYLPITPGRNDGATIHKLTVEDVPVDGFWSITVYNAEGYLEPNQYNAYAVNNITANKGADGSVAIEFGGCDGEIPNCLPIMKAWNYTVRLSTRDPRSLTVHGNFPRRSLSVEPGDAEGPADKEPGDCLSQ